MEKAQGKFPGKSSSDSFKTDPVKWKKTEEGDEMTENPEWFNDTYRTLAEIIGSNAVVKLWKNYAGLTITFPQKLYSKEFSRRYIQEHMETDTIQSIAKKVNLSERRIRQIVHELKERQE